MLQLARRFIRNRLTANGLWIVWQPQVHEPLALAVQRPLDAIAIENVGQLTESLPLTFIVSTVAVRIGALSWSAGNGLPVAIVINLESVRCEWAISCSCGRYDYLHASVSAINLCRAIHTRSVKGHLLRSGFEIVWGEFMPIAGQQLKVLGMNKQFLAPGLMLRNHAEIGHLV